MKKTKRTGGDCYRVAGRLIMTPEYEGGMLCHGSVYHPETGRHGHAWIEMPDGEFDVVICHDVANGNDLHLPRDVYYHFGKVEHVKRYTAEEAAKLMLRTKHFGPWDEVNVKAAHAAMKGGKR